MKKIMTLGLMLAGLVLASYTVFVQQEKGEIDYCRAFDKGDGKQLVYVEGELVKHFARPVMVVDCFPGLVKDSQGNQIKSGGDCKQPDPIYMFSFANNKMDISSEKGTVLVFSGVTFEKANELKDQLAINKKYAICGSVRYPSKDKASLFAIPVVEGILPSLKSIP